MKKTMHWIMIAWIALGLTGALAETPLGFGYVNTNRTNVREKPGGFIVERLDDGQAVYITGWQRDSRDRLWYHVNTEHNGDRRLTAWVQADYVTAGSELFYDIVQIAAGEKGMLALRSDGTVVGVADENVGTRIFRKTIAQWKNVKQVACGFMTYNALLEDGSLRGFGNMAYEDWNSVRGVRLLDAKGMNIAYVTADGVFNREKDNAIYLSGAPLDWQTANRIIACEYAVIAQYPDGGLTCVSLINEALSDVCRDAAQWNDLAALDCGERIFSVAGTDTVRTLTLVAALHRDGTVSTLPENFLPETDAWTGITDVKAGRDFVLGLRADGTVAATGVDASIAEQVSQWMDITVIDACMGYCIGLKEDGTLVFAGEYTF